MAAYMVAWHSLKTTVPCGMDIVTVLWQDNCHNGVAKLCGCILSHRPPVHALEASGTIEPMDLGSGQATR